ncbi:MAG: type II toxin-antitoxin system VapC family toxin [Pseudonocardiaceae bacterium]
MIVLDTTVLVYAVGAAHPLRTPCRRLIAERTSAITTTAGVIQEFVHVRSRRRSRAEAVQLGTAYLTLLSPLLDVPDRAVMDALELLGQHCDLGAFDAVLAAAARAARCEALVTADRAFGEIDGLPVRYPDAVGLSDLLPGQ